MQTQELHNLVTSVYRQSAGNLVSILTGIFGPANIELAEDVVQDALLEALKNWEQGVPDNPAAWLMRTAKNKAITILRREKYKQAFINHESFLVKQDFFQEEESEALFSESAINDDLLRMMFVCCHPELSRESQTTLILKTLCGFSITEIARAYLTNEATITKRLVRARQVVRDLGIQFELPRGNKVNERVDGVLDSIYLLFNEGYSATFGDTHIRLDICSEAIRLCRILTEHKIGKSSAGFSLISLMCLNASRFSARTDDDGNILLLNEQDRNLWNRALIQSGLQYLQKAADLGIINTYYIQAAVSACHCIAPTYQQTNWQEILSLYDLLIKVDHSPVILLNRVVAFSKVHGITSALNELQKIAQNKALDNYYLFYAVKGELLLENKDFITAHDNFNKALSLTQNKSEQKILRDKIAKCIA